MFTTLRLKLASQVLLEMHLIKSGIGTHRWESLVVPHKYIESFKRLGLQQPKEEPQIALVNFKHDRVEVFCF